jgi:hypothetical protein
VAYRDERVVEPCSPLTVTPFGTYAALELLAACQRLPNPVTLVTRLRLDAALYDPAPPATGKRGRPRKKGARQLTLKQRLSDPTTTWQEVSLRFLSPAAPCGWRQEARSGITVGCRRWPFAGC